MMSLIKSVTFKWECIYQVYVKFKIYRQKKINRCWRYFAHNLHMINNKLKSIFILRYYLDALQFIEYCHCVVIMLVLFSFFYGLSINNLRPFIRCALCSIDSVVWKENQYHLVLYKFKCICIYFLYFIFFWCCLILNENVSNYIFKNGLSYDKLITHWY